MRMPVSADSACAHFALARQPPKRHEPGLELRSGDCNYGFLGE